MGKLSGGITHSAMTRYLVDVYRIEIPENGERRDDLVEATEDWLGKLGRNKCYQFQVQGNTQLDIALHLARKGHLLNIP